MRRALLAALALLFLSPIAAHAANCSAYPFTLTNGTTADATQVMSNFNTILSCGNTNLAHNGANSDITSLTGLSTPLAVNQGGTASTTAANALTALGAFPTAGGTHTGTVTFVAGTTTVAPFRFQAGSLLTSAVAHTIEWDGVNLYATQAAGPTRQTLAYLTSNITGSAAKWTTARNLSLTGDVTATLSAVDGSGNVSAAATIAAAAVTGAKIASATVANANLSNMAAATVKCRASGAGSGAPTDCTGAQVATILGPPVAKAWVYFTISGGVVTVQDSYGVTSVSRTSAGKYTITFSTAFASTNFAALCSVSVASLATYACDGDATTGRSTTTDAVGVVLSGSGLVDPAAVNYTAFGN